MKTVLNGLDKFYTINFLILCTTSYGKSGMKKTQSEKRQRKIPGRNCRLVIRSEADILYWQSLQLNTGGGWELLHFVGLAGFPTAFDSQTYFVAKERFVLTEGRLC